MVFRVFYAWISLTPETNHLNLSSLIELTDERPIFVKGRRRFGAFRVDRRFKKQQARTRFDDRVDDDRVETLLRRRSRQIHPKHRTRIKVSIREALLKGKARYGRPPCTN